jgi:hypothetical protein
MVGLGPGASSVRGATVGFFLDVEVLLDVFELSVLELLAVAVLVSEPQPDSTTARAVNAAATPVIADAFMN